MIAVENSADFEEVSHQVDVLITTARTGAYEATVSQMKALVPDFKSLNSVYEKLDSTSH